MTTTREIQGTNGADNLTGGDTNDLIYAYAAQGPGTETLRAELVASGLEAPLFATAPPDDVSSLFVVEKAGRILQVDLTDGTVETFLDIRNQVLAEGEGGLLGLAFHPDHAANGLFYVSMTNADGDLELRAFPGNDSLLTVDRPSGFTNHYGGWLGFGPDGLLYTATGDGGGVGDPSGNAQNLDSLLGKIVRINIGGDGFPNDPALDYAIPADNPFAAGPGADEVWALGLRNPWRASFDHATGDFLIGDVGQDNWEEIDLGERGANYGWNLFEGPAPFAPPVGEPPSPLIASLFAYSHGVGQAVIGGYVYRGPAEAMQGQYFFADFGSSRLWTLDGDTVTERTDLLSFSGPERLDNPTSFGEDARGNLYVTDQDGDVFRLVSGGIADAGDVVQAGGGDDIVYGGAGNDILRGGDGADELRGQSGNDLLEGGAGVDRMEGGAGADRFAGTDGDIILDFTPGTDTVVLPASATTRAEDGDTILIFNGDEAVTLKAVAPQDLHPGDFMVG